MRFLLYVVVLVLLGPTCICADEPVSYQNTVMALLSRSGCNAGTCHGNLNGKGGFKLSLRGQDPLIDFRTLTRGSLGRRINLQSPQHSLMLLKATTSVPHEGGQRFSSDSDAYRLLFQWIEQGANYDKSAPSVTRLEVTPVESFLVEPLNTLQIRARAFFTDGTQKDVTSLAVFESTNPRMEVSRNGLVQSKIPGETTIVVRYLQHQSTAQVAFVPKRPDYQGINVPVVHYIDEHIVDRLKKLRANPSDLCSDRVFLRRAYLDLLGMLPTIDQIQTFLADERPDKRERLVVALLDRPEFADYWALRFSDFLRNEPKQLDSKGSKIFYQWIRAQIVKDVPLNEFAAKLIASRGSTYKHPEANYYRALRDTYTRSEATAQVFLGIRMQCAKCHNHPFNKWTQDDYHQFAAFFSQIDYKLLNNKRKDRLDKHEFIGEQVVFLNRKKQLKHPVSGKVLAPKLLGDESGRKIKGKDELQVLADWVAHSNNPYFARTQANRIWSYLMGRGIVEPNDDFRDSNPPANGPLLDALAKDFAGHQYDMKYLIRTIMASRTYQLSSIPNDTNKNDETNFSHTIVQSIAAEPLLNAVCQVTEVPVKFDGYPLGTRATQLPSMPIAHRRVQFDDGIKFLRVFGKPERLLNCDCERSDTPTMAQALQFITGPIIEKGVSTQNNRLGRLLKEGKSDKQIVDEIFLAALCRLPGARVRDALIARIEAAPDRRRALEDVLWAVLNSKEFLLRK